MRFAPCVVTASLLAMALSAPAFAEDKPPISSPCRVWHIPTSSA